MSRGSETITIREPTDSFDPNGDPVGNAVPSKVARGCSIWPRESTEQAEGGRRIVEGLNVYIPAGQPVPTELAIVGARGLEYEVDGVPGHYIKGARDKGYIVVLARSRSQGRGA